MNRIIIIVAGLVLALIFGLILVWPQYQKLQALNSAIENKREELRSREAYFAKVKEVSAQLQEYPEALAKISAALPKDPSLAAFINFLQTNSAQTGLILKKMVLGGTAAPSADKKSFTETQFIIQASGSYESFKNFLSLIENSARIIEVQNISIEIPPKESKESATFTLNLKTTSY